MKFDKLYWIDLMMKEAVNNFIKNNLIVNGKVVSKRCRREWFDNTHNTEMYDEIQQLTDFLPTSATLIQRIWHVYNGVFYIPVCAYDNTTPTNFKSFKDGYYIYSSSSVSSKSDTIKHKIRERTFEKYGVGSYTQSETFKEQAKKTWIEKYGVDNPSKSKVVSDKKRKKCIENYGVEWPQQSDIVRKLSVSTNLKKYGVENPMMNTDIQRKVSNSRLEIAYERFFDNPKFFNRMTPLFTLDDYNGIGDEYPFKCKRCDGEFYDVLRGGKIPRCYNCYPNTNISVSETELADYIEKELGFTIIRSDKSILGGRELDIYIPSKGIAIEFNGLYYHSEIGGGKDANYHITKTKQCEDVGVRLIHIFEDEWSELKEVVKSRLKHILGKVDNRIYARKCEVREISSSDAQTFLNETHIQQYTSAKVKIGLYSGDELVGVMTLSNRKIFNKSDEWELVRFSTSVNVVGGFSKMLSYFERTYKPTSVVSYALRRWLDINDNVYSTNGFVVDGMGYPGFFYVKSGHRYNRIGFQKHKLKGKLKTFDETLTEWENMQLNGYDRIWDCGSVKYIKKY
jgi:hypothetical protein